MRTLTVNLNNSVIEANKEGGIYSWETTIKLSNSHIKDNYSADGGGVLA